MKRSGPIRRYTPLRPRKPPARSSTPIPRGGPIARGKAPRKVNPERRQSEFPRAYGSRARVKFVASLPCAADGVIEPGIPNDNAHTETGGMGRKGHYTTIISLCPRCHHKQHQSGWMAIGMTAESRRRAAARTEEAWAAHQHRGSEDDAD